MNNLKDVIKIVYEIDCELETTTLSDYRAGLLRAKRIISSVPFARALEARYGRWESLEAVYGDDRHCRCTECKEEVEFEVGNVNLNLYRYCPHCGAVMTGESNRITIEDFCEILLTKIQDVFDTEFSGRKRMMTKYKDCVSDAIMDTVYKYVVNCEDQNYRLAHGDFVTTQNKK